jgi:hypothetical protein
MINSSEVFDSIRRGYTDLQDGTSEDIINYFENIDQSSLDGHINNIKGILFEQEYIDKLEEEGIKAEVFEETNHPITDIKIYDEDENIIEELQLKATDSDSYIKDTLEEHPDIPIVATTEVAQSMESDMVIDSGISNAILEESIIETLSPVSKIGLAFGGIGLLFGLPF